MKIYSKIWKPKNQLLCYGFLITDELNFWLPNFGIDFHFSASLSSFFTINISLFLLLAFYCSDCLHFFGYIYARLLC